MKNGAVPFLLSQWCDCREKGEESPGKWLLLSNISLLVASSISAACGLEKLNWAGIQQSLFENLVSYGVGLLMFTEIFC